MLVKYLPLILGNKTHWVITAFTSTLFITSPVLADEHDTNNVWGIGVGIATAEKPYIDVDRDTTVLPLLYFENKYMRFFGTSVEAKLPDWQINNRQKLNFGLIARYDGSGYEAEDAPILEGMVERKGGIWAGAKAEWKNNFVNIQTEWAHDVSGNSKGQRVVIGVDRTWQLGEKLSLTPRMNAIWHDSKYNDYYYGVTEAEATTHRPAYEGEDGISTELGILGTYQFAKHHTLMLDVQGSVLSSEVKDSPLVDKSSGNRIFFGYMYRF